LENGFIKEFSDFSLFFQKYVFFCPVSFCRPIKSCRLDEILENRLKLAISVPPGKDSDDFADNRIEDPSGNSIK